MDVTGAEGYLRWILGLIFLIRKGNIIRQINTSKPV